MAEMDEELVAHEELVARNYQVNLMTIALEQNTIIYLPTGSGKTFIAILVLRTMSESLSKPYNEGGKLSVILVNTVALVDQHVGYLRAHTVLKIAGYSGEMKLDHWKKNEWLRQFNENQVLVMTSQIFLNLIVSNYIDLTQVNLLIFDECHHAVDDHPMRQIMKTFQTYPSEQLPRILGLTATLLNRNCKIEDIEQEVKTLETTCHSQVATLEEFEGLVGYRTNPREILETYKPSIIDKNQEFAINLITQAITHLSCVKLDDDIVTDYPFDDSVEPLETKDILKQLKNLLKDFIIHIKVFGIYGGMKTSIAFTIKVERLRIHCTHITLNTILNYVLTLFGVIRQSFDNIINQYPNNCDKIYKLSSFKLLKLITILENFKTNSEEELCCIIFVQRRSTAKILHHILDDLRQFNPRLNYLKSNFIVGASNNPYKTTRESMYLTKKNREVIQDFANSEINTIVSSNVLEEGVDIKKCTLVIKFDKSEDYRSYIQSKGRARHASSLYYTMVEETDYFKYKQKYYQFQKIEEQLNSYLLGKNLERSPPKSTEITQMYNEDILPPYYVNGSGTAQVNVLTAISLLSRYCLSLPRDQYTVYSPEWYRKVMIINGKKKIKVIIKLPVICPIQEPIESSFMTNKKDAKRAAALKACILLHKCGELSDDLLPVVKTIRDEDVSFLFKHWPKDYQKTDGNARKKRLHDKQLVEDLKFVVKSNQASYLHVITIEPLYNYDDFNIKTVQDLYRANLKYGFLTSKPLPNLCRFPVYDTYGEILIQIENNRKIVELTDAQINEIKDFHYLIFNNVLDILKIFLQYDNNGDNTEHLLLIPIIVDGDNIEIDFDTIYKNKNLEEITQPSALARKNIEVNEDDYLHAIVSPWYRNQMSSYYVVTRVCLDKTPLSEFPNADYQSFQKYYEDKHSLEIYNYEQPLLLVKGLSKNLNLVKPTSHINTDDRKELKRKREKRYDEIDEMLIPELVVKQNFPSSLWIQARLLPTIINRLLFLLKLYRLQQDIGKSLNLKVVEHEDDLKIDILTLNNSDSEDDNDKQPEQIQQFSGNLNDLNQGLLQIELTTTIRGFYNKDYSMKRLQAEYPWRNLDEPKDIERDIDVNLMDIEYYEKFISQPLKQPTKINQNKSPIKQLPAITYNKDFVDIDLKLLQNFYSDKNPKLYNFYQALTTIQSRDIVNLERLETLGDSFLKLISSLYCLLRFPKFNEGQLTMLKSRLVSNRNLFYLGQRINIGGILKVRQFEPKHEWLPPSFIIPKQIQNLINQKKYSINSLFNLKLKQHEQKSGVLTKTTLNDYLNTIDDNNKIIDDIDNNNDEDSDELNSYVTMGQFMNKQLIKDKNIADCIEALLGVYFLNNGLYGGVRFLQWLQLLPNDENLEGLFNIIDLNPIVNPKLNVDDYIKWYIPQCDEFERIIGYKFNNRTYLLQALTHTSFIPNRLTLSYQRLEFIGDAILDFLITIYIYENCGDLNPGEITDLRSALVNNNIFACLLVRNSLHKFLLLISQQLQNLIDKFVKLMEMKDYQIDDEILILLDENDLNISECIDIPKILGDIFEAIAGAIYLDCGKDLQIVWKIFYRLMWHEIDMFSKKVPKNVIRRLYECPAAYPVFSASEKLDNDQIMVALEFMCEGRKKRVYGVGSNQVTAKRAAAKIALRALKL